MNRSKDSVARFAPGRAYQRAELHDRFGGQRQGGISTPRQTDFVMLFSSPKGKASGYADRWDSPDIYLYTGEGQLGDMAFTRGNKAIRDHEKNDKKLYLFEDANDGYWRYVCQLAYKSHFIEKRPDRAGHVRDAIIFRLEVIEPSAE